MGAPNIKDVLTAFSPSLDLFAICAGDGRIKIWDALNGHIQTEFADLTSSDATSTYAGSMKGHLSIDYTCMEWLSLERKKKRKHTSSLLVLGTGSGDVLALDVAAGQLNWRIDDCHPGGVKAVSSSSNGSCVYTAGADGMVCKIDCKSGNVLEKFKASTKAVSSVSVSSDGKTIATAAAQLKIFDSSDNKKIQKFFGHPGSVRCLVFTEDGKYILSSAVGERYVAVWKIDGANKKTVSCVLAMEHPAVFLDSRCTPGRELGNVGVCILAISEVGDCYVWFGNSFEELHNVKPTKISFSLEDMSSRNHMGASPAVYAAKLESVNNHTSGQILLVHGLLVKPSFQKISVQSGSDIKLNFSDDGILLRLNKQPLVKSKKTKDAKKVTALDRANAEDALLPIPKLFDSHLQEKQVQDSSGMEVMDDLVRNNESISMKIEDEMAKGETDVICMEGQMRSLGILDDENDLESNIKFSSSLLKGVDLEAPLPMRKIRSTVVTMEPSEAYKLLGVLMTIWQLRSSSGKYALPWIYSILVIHSHYLISQEDLTQKLASLIKIAGSRGSAVETLLQLSGRLQLVTTQINKASIKTTHSVRDPQMVESEDEDQEDYVEVEGDETSEISSDDDDS